MADLQEPTPDESDERLIELLDGYVDTLHDADDASRNELLSHHAELAKFLGCLDALDSLAIPQKPGFSKKKRTAKKAVRFVYYKKYVRFCY